MWLSVSNLFYPAHCHLRACLQFVQEAAHFKGHLQLVEWLRPFVVCLSFAFKQNQYIGERENPLTLQQPLFIHWRYSLHYVFLFFFVLPSSIALSTFRHFKSALQGGGRHIVLWKVLPNCSLADDWGSVCTMMMMMMMMVPSRDRLIHPPTCHSRLKATRGCQARFWQPPARDRSVGE